MSVELLDVMGDDLAIVLAARVSYAKQSAWQRIGVCDRCGVNLNWERNEKCAEHPLAKTINVENQLSSADAGLISYLARNRHGTPFEMCLDGNTLIPTMPCPGAQQKAYTIRDLAHAFESLGRQHAWVKLVKIRTVQPDGSIVATKIKRAWHTGQQDTWRVTEDSRLGRSIVVTINHPFLTPAGTYASLETLAVGDEIVLNGRAVLEHSDLEQLWNEGRTLPEIAEQSGLSRTSVYRILREMGVDTARRVGFQRKASVLSRRKQAQRLKAKDLEKGCEICGAPALDVNHIDKDQTNNDPDNLIAVCRPCHKAFDQGTTQLKTYTRRIAKIEHVGLRDVYDLEVESDNHNFVADGYVVHNCVFKFRVRCPIGVAREWQRHRIGSFNEVSTRYVEMAPEFYVPPVEAVRIQVGKPGHYTFEPASESQANGCAGTMELAYRSAYEAYQALLANGVAKELARNVLPLGLMTEFIWCVNLRSLTNFLSLRTATNALLEIRQEAGLVEQHVKKIVPVAYQAWVDGGRQSL